MRRCIVAVLAAALAGCHGPQPDAGPRRVRIAIHRDPIAFLPFRAADALGYYKAEGLEVVASELAAGPKAVEALVGGSADVAVASFTDIVLLASRRQGVPCFLLLYTRPLFALAVAPNLIDAIRTPRDLKGRTVGVSAPGSASHQFLRFLLSTTDLSVDDVSVASVGMAATSLAALEYNKVDAAVLLGSGIGAYEERHGRGAFIVDTRSPASAKQFLGSDVFPSLGLIAHEEWLRVDAETAERLTRAVKKGMKWVREQPAAKVRELIRDDAHLASVEAELQAIRDVQSVLSSDGLVPDDSLDPIRTFVAASEPAVRSADFDLRKAYTNRFAAAR